MFLFAVDVNLKLSRDNNSVIVFFSWYISIIFFIDTNSVRPKVSFDSIFKTELYNIVNYAIHL